MKRNLVKFLSLVLCLMLACPAALAQGSAYIIGETTNSLLADALRSGQMLTASTKLGIELDAAALGLSEEEAAQMDVLLGVLDQATFTGGFGLIDEGVRLTLEGELADAATGDAVSIDAAVNMTLDGLSVESDLIAGRRLTAKWETLLALAGLDEIEVALFSEGKELLRSALNTDLEQVIETFVTSFSPMLELAVHLVTPYAGTIGTFVAGLPMEMAHDLNEEGYPPTATEIAITVTEKDLGDLLILLCDQAEQDDTLKQWVDSILTAYAEGMTTAQLIAELRAVAAEMTDTSVPILFFIGLNESNIPLYVEAMVIDEESGENLYVGFFCYEDAEAGLIVELTGGLYDVDGNPYVNLHIGGSYLGDPADPNVHDAQIVFSAAEGETPLAGIFMTYTVVPVNGSELPAYDVSTTYSMFAEDGTQMVNSTEGRFGLTAAGGEFSTATSQADTYVEGSLMSVTAAAEILVEPTADGSITGCYRISESMPHAGISDFTMDATLGSEAYDLAQTEALTLLELEKLTNDEMDALTSEVYSLLLDDKLTKVLEILPAEVIEMLMAEGAE